MPDDLESDPLIRFGLAANLASRYAADQRGFFQYLVKTLELTIPDSVEPERKGGLFSSKRVSAISLPLGDDLYRLEDGARGLVPSRTHVVRGIKLKTETLSIDAWLAEVGAALEEEARSSQAARDALEVLFGG
ncbi:MAG: hypothetical protein HY248_06240 [Fimbriimonas ginsengisoli]|nr:hypothetical protein [Fimbriimonas ginsengisoli]